MVVGIVNCKTNVVITFLILIIAVFPACVGISAAGNLDSLIKPIKVKKRDPGLLISVESVLNKLRENKKIILVDVRKESEFKKFRIPNSINIPLYAIKTKAFLKSELLVIVNEGYDYGKLADACEHLRTACFNVWILNGGLYYWSRKGAPLVGGVFARKVLNRVPPSVLFAEKDYENWIVVDTSPSKTRNSGSFMVRSLSIPYLNNNEQFRKAFERKMAPYRHNQFVSVLVLNETGDSYNVIEKILQETDFNNVFFLKGGIESYIKFSENQTVISRDTHTVRKTLKKCLSCP